MVVEGTPPWSARAQGQPKFDRAYVLGPISTVRSYMRPRVGLLAVLEARLPASNSKAPRSFAKKRLPIGVRELFVVISSLALKHGIGVSTAHAAWSLGDRALQ